MCCSLARKVHCWLPHPSKHKGRNKKTPPKLSTIHAHAYSDPTPSLQRGSRKHNGQGKGYLFIYLFKGDRPSYVAQAGLQLWAQVILLPQPRESVSRSSRPHTWLKQKILKSARGWATESFQWELRRGFTLPEVLCSQDGHGCPSLSQLAT